MKKILPILAVSFLLTGGLALGQTASLSFDDNVGVATSGTYNQTATITLDVIYTFSGGTSTGLSYWLETESGVASALTLTGETYGASFPTAQDGEVKPWAFTSSSGADSGFLHAVSATQSGDAGATNNTAQAAGTYDPVATLTFSLVNAAPGTYHIETTHLTPLISEGTVNLNDTPFSSQAIYTFTVVPEPGTLSLLGRGGLGSLGLSILRARRKI